MITRASAFCSARRLGLARRMHACTIRRQIRRSDWDAVSRRPIRPLERSLSGQGSDAVHGADIRSSDLECLEGVRLDVPSLFPAPCHALGHSAGRLQKGRWDGCLFPVTPPVTCVLGGEASGAFNAVARVRASGGGRRPCARRPPVRVSLFRIRR